MANIKVISSYALIAYIWRTFRPSHSSWVHDAIENIGMAMEIIGYHGGFINKPICHEVAEHKALLKCMVYGIQGVEYNGTRLKFNGGLNLNPSGCMNLPLNNSEYYNLNPNYIQTSFEEGTVYIHAQVVPTDDKGFPMIPDNALFKQAVSYWIMGHILASGYVHPVFTYEAAMQLWEKFYPQAQNDMMFPSIDQMDLFRSMWTNPIPDAIYDTATMFNSDSRDNGGLNQLIDPSTLLPITFP